MLRINDISKVYQKSDGAVHALKDVSLHVAEGEFVSVRGSSGSGKTTLLLAAGALLEPSSGTVELDGRDPYAAGTEERAALRAAKIGFVFQQFHLVSYLSVLENVLSPSLALSGDGAGERAEELIGRFGLTHRISHLPSELSAGECQRVALARALLNRPKLVLADEPTGNLDQCNADIVLDSLAQFAEGGGAALMVTHSAEVAHRAGRTIRLEAGSILSE
ncbi:MAG: ABC transporter ATP-binding protein [Planctomycetota bacterium]